MNSGQGLIRSFSSVWSPDLFALLNISQDLRELCLRGFSLPLFTMGKKETETFSKYLFITY